MAAPPCQEWKKATIVAMPESTPPRLVPDRSSSTDKEDNEKSCWGITKRDYPLHSSAAILVMNHAHMVLQKRLSGVRASGDLDTFAFETSLPRFDNKDIELGRKVASGNFADIYAIQFFRPTGPDSSKACSEEPYDEAEMVKRIHLTRASGSSTQLVVKVLRAQLLGDTALYATGAADLVTEGSLLASLNHPHILSIKGRSLSSVEGFASGRRDAFFLVLERVQCNLLDRLREWKKESSGNRLITRGVRGRLEQSAALLRERVHTMMQLADAMAYLHKKNIIHRDLKLGNVGIDHGGNVKLLDFGLAKILPPSRDEREKFLLTGNTGSIRYMAPEIGRGEPYNLKADVFSFGILLYEVLNLEKTWNGWQADDIRQRVHLRKQRPAISIFWPAALKQLLRSIWSDLPAARLSMEHVQTILATHKRGLSHR